VQLAEPVHPGQETTLPVVERSSMSSGKTYFPPLVRIPNAIATA
jgi:hypothetical protein